MASHAVAVTKYVDAQIDHHQAILSACVPPDAKIYQTENILEIAQLDNICYAVQLIHPSC